MEMNNYLSEFTCFYCQNSIETAKNYRRASKDFIEFTMNRQGWNMDELVVKANKRDVLYYIKELESRDISPYSINFYISAISTFFRYLIEFEYKDGLNPCENVQRLNTQGIEQKQEYLTEDEYKRLLEVVKIKEGRQRKFEFTSKRDTFLLTLNLSLGLRGSESLALTVKQFDNDIITVKGKGNKFRSFKITDEIRNAFNEYMKVRHLAFNEDQEDEGLLFVSVTGKQLHTKDINKNLKKYAERADICKDLSSHCLRRSCITRYLSMGVPVAQVSKLAGHSNSATTMRYFQADASDFDFPELGL